jgi:hypothetical protein
MPEQKIPVSGAFRLASLMYFCSGQPMHFCSGVDIDADGYSSRSAARTAATAAGPPIKSCRARCAAPAAAPRTGRRSPRSPGRAGRESSTPSDGGAGRSTTRHIDVHRVDFIVGAMGSGRHLPASSLHAVGRRSTSILSRSSSGTPTGRHSPTSISRTSRGGAPRAPHPRRGRGARCYQCC